MVDGYKTQLFDIKMNGTQRVRMTKNNFDTTVDVTKFVESYEF